ncbi:DUF6086 family protein [Streptomyces sp. NPDC005722]
MGPTEDDEARIDPAALGRFVGALLARHLRTRRDVMRALGEGFTATAPVLAERAGVDADRSAPAPDGPLRDVRVPWPRDVPLPHAPLTRARTYDSETSCGAACTRLTTGAFDVARTSNIANSASVGEAPSEAPTACGMLLPCVPRRTRSVIWLGEVGRTSDSQSSKG